MLMVVVGLGCGCGIRRVSLMRRRLGSGRRCFVGGVDGAPMGKVGVAREGAGLGGGLF